MLDTDTDQCAVAVLDAMLTALDTETRANRLERQITQIRAMPAQNAKGRREDVKTLQGTARGLLADMYATLAVWNKAKACLPESVYTLSSESGPRLPVAQVQSLLRQLDKVKSVEEAFGPASSMADAGQEILTPLKVAWMMRGHGRLLDDSTKFFMPGETE